MAQSVQVGGELGKHLAQHGLHHVVPGDVAAQWLRASAQGGVQRAIAQRVAALRLAGRQRQHGDVQRDVPRQIEQRGGRTRQQLQLQLANRHAALSAGDLPQVQCHLDHTAIAPAHRPGRAFKCRGKARLQRGKHRALGVQALPGGRGLQSGLHQRGPRHRHLPLTTQAQCGITAVAGLEGLQPLRRVIPAHPAQAQGHALGAQGLRGCVEVDVVHLLAHGLAARQRWQTRQLTGQAGGVGRGQGQLDFKLCTRAVLAGRGHGVCLARSRRHGEGPLPEMSAGSRHAP